jgi:hypothetical protein
MTRMSEPLSKDDLRALFLANGFEIKPGHDDLKPYVYQAGFAVVNAVLSKLASDAPFGYYHRKRGKFAHEFDGSGADEWLSLYTRPTPSAEPSAELVDVNRRWLAAFLQKYGPREGMAIDAEAWSFVHAAISAVIAAPSAEPPAWLRVIDEAMVGHHMGVADASDDYSTARDKMNRLLAHAQDIGAFHASADAITVTLTVDADYAKKHIETMEAMAAEIRKQVAATAHPKSNAEQNGHVLYATGDADKPRGICDWNGEVVLAQCRRCGKAEVELEGVACTAPSAGPSIDPMQDPLRPSLLRLGSPDEHPAEGVLRALASWLGVGGFNAPTVDANLFHHKIVSGIESLIADKRPSAALSEPMGVAGEMPGSAGGFTIGVFKASDVPVGTKLYTRPAPATLPAACMEAMRKAAATLDSVARGDYDGNAAEARDDLLVQIGGGR